MTPRVGRADPVTGDDVAIVGRVRRQHRVRGPRGNRAILVLAGLVLLLGACGNDEVVEEPPSETDDASAAPDEPAPEPDEADAADEPTAAPDVTDGTSTEAAPDEPAQTNPGGTGTATVTVDGETSSFVVITCALTPDEDPSGLLQFGGSAVAPETPSAVIAEALRGYAEDDGSDPDATMARNAENTQTFLQYGPVFTWQRWLDADDLPDDLAFLAGDIVALALTGTDAWLADSSTGFIDREGRSFRASIDAVKIGEGAGEVTDNLTFEATCP